MCVICNEIHFLYLELAEYPNDHQTKAIFFLLLSVVPLRLVRSALPSPSFPLSLTLSSSLCLGRGKIPGHIFGTEKIVPEMSGKNKKNIRSEKRPTRATGETSTGEKVDKWATRQVKSSFPFFSRYFKKFQYCSYAPYVRICYPKTDGVSSTEHLLEWPILRLSVWIVAISTCAANSVVFTWRVISKKEDRVLSLFIKNLSSQSGRTFVSRF